MRGRVHIRGPVASPPQDGLQSHGSADHTVRPVVLRQDRARYLLCSESPRQPRVSSVSEAGTPGAPRLEDGFQSPHLTWLRVPACWLWLAAFSES